MRTNTWYLSLHWAARVCALLIAGFLSLFYFGESISPDGKLTLVPPHLALRDKFLLLLILCCVLAVLLAWFWERWAGMADVLFAGTFLLCCIVMENMHRVWWLGVALLLPGALYVTAAELRRHSLHAVN